MNALGSLLSKVESIPAKTKPISKSAKANYEDDVSMVSAPLASGGGGNALGDLLSRAKKDEPEVEN